MTGRRARVGPRALGLLAAGAAALVAAGGFGTPALAVLGAGLIALPLLAAGLVAVAALGLRLERSVEPARLGAGGACRARVRASGWPARLRLTALLDWSIDPGLGALGRPVAEERRTGPPETRVRVAPVSRGVHRLGPATLRLADPFGLVSATRTAGAGDVVTAVPAAPEIRRPFWARGAVRGAGGASGRGRGGGELEGVRDSRPGDPLSHIHWPQTAKRGRLQAKDLRGAEAGAGAALVILDDRADPACAGKPDGPFEVAVAAAAALVRHLAERGVGVELAVPGAGVALGPSPEVWGAAEDALARVEAEGGMPLSLALRAACAGEATPRRVVLVSAAPDAGLPDAVRAARGSGRSVACALCGPAGPAAGELARAGAGVVWVPGMEDLSDALSGEGRRARLG